MLAITPAVTATRTRALALSLALHLAVIALAAHLHRAPPAPAPARITEMFEIEAPPTRPEPEPEPPAPSSAPRASTPRASTPRAARAAAPAPIIAPDAQPAAAPQEVLDFGSTLVTSPSAAASSFASPSGGAQPGATPRSRSPSRGSGTGDLSRAPALVGTAEWRCPFPHEADAADIDHAVVTLRIDVAASGAALSAQALSDPGHGFAQIARSCALRKRFSPALGRDGTARRATATVHVTFDR